MSAEHRAKLLSWLDEERDRQLSFLQAFTRIDTCNPPGDTREAADLVRAFLAEEGIPCRDETPVVEMPNLISSFDGTRDGYHLVLNGHLDVFPIGDRDAWAHDPLSGDVIDGRVYGRGTVDMKCGTSALIFVHAYLHRLRGCLPGKVTLTVVSDEETGGRWGADWLTQQCGDEVLGDCVLNSEPSGLETIRFGEKSILWVRFDVSVPGGHSAYPHTSLSATKIAARLIGDLVTIEDLQPDEPSAVHETMDRPAVQAAIDQALGAGAAQVARRVSVNIGTIAGGVKINMLPDSCTLDVDFRLPVGIERARVLSEVARIVTDYPNVSFTELLAGGPEANWSDPGHEMMTHLRRAAGEAVGAEPQPIISLGGTDTRFWRTCGVPSFVYGCSPAGMGATDESVSVREFHCVMRAHALAAFDYLTGFE